jgi:ABC-type multidrug transport system ATPase subunit
MTGTPSTVRHFPVPDAKPHVLDMMKTCINVTPKNVWFLDMKQARELMAQFQTQNRRSIYFANHILYPEDFCKGTTIDPNTMALSFSAKERRSTLAAATNIPKEQRTEEQIRRALELVSAQEVVDRMENGLDSDVGEGGDMLSTGEKQLISFARAILADPRILVLDEATASVDTISEQKIQSAIETIIKGRTSLVIAHRLSTVKNADLILVVRDGKIIERGRHDELLKMRGHYYNLYTRQYEEDAVSSVFSTN